MIPQSLLHGRSLRFAPEEIRALAEGIATGAVDRFAEVGQALQFSAIWDGYDLLQQFSRQVALR